MFWICIYMTLFTYYMSQNLLRGDNGTTDLKRKITVICKMIYFFMGLNKNIVIRDNKNNFMHQNHINLFFT